MGDLLQFKRLTSATVMQTFTIDGTPTDLDSGVPVVTITRPDGTTIASGTVSNSWAGPPARSTGQYRFVLAGQPQCTLLDVTWAGTIGGQPQTLQNTIEIVGAHLFTEPAMRALRVAGGTPFSLTATPLFTDQQIMDARAATLDEFTQILGFSPVPRFHRETHDGDGSGCVLLNELEAGPLLSVTVGGIAQSVGGYTLKPSGILEATSNYTASGTFTAGRGNVTVEYVAGWPRVMGDGSNIAMLRAAMRLYPGISSSATSVTTPDGVSYSFDPAGQVTRAGNIRHFGIPAIDSWLNRWSQAGFAVA
jgi:hypothetical protein